MVMNIQPIQRPIHRATVHTLSGKLSSRYSKTHNRNRKIYSPNPSSLSHNMNSHNSSSSRPSRFHRRPSSPPFTRHWRIQDS
jgi:hypothetical protein